MWYLSPSLPSTVDQQPAHCSTPRLRAVARGLDLAPQHAYWGSLPASWRMARERYLWAGGDSWNIRRLPMLLLQQRVQPVQQDPAMFSPTPLASDTDLGGWRLRKVRRGWWDWPSSGTINSRNAFTPVDISYSTSTSPAVLCVAGVVHGPSPWCQTIRRPRFTRPRPFGGSVGHVLSSRR